ncbi:hypothetical protein AB0C93_03880 [Streptomyces sp. NPDC048518]|uniref:hypothetical protein n=1 Tax=Streptomyces sp. NPDC048518 TaxID=3155029 RepID=UPI0033C0AECF
MVGHRGHGLPAGQELLFTVDTFRTQVRLTGVTSAEDPAHPDSWLRDVQLQWWDTGGELWKDGSKLLSDAGAVHSPTFEPLSSSRFRLRTTGGGIWPVGNIRLGELVFHGSVVGNSHRGRPRREGPRRPLRRTGRRRARPHRGQCRGGHPARRCGRRDEVSAG